MNKGIITPERSEAMKKRSKGLDGNITLFPTFNDACKDVERATE